MKVWLTHSQNTLLERAVKESGEWVLEHLGCRDDLEVLEDNGFIETRRRRGVACIAFRVRADRLILKLDDGYHMAV